jgi:Zn-dependent M28 family amino/carboxypeptidase
LPELVDRLTAHVRTLAATPRLPGSPEHRQARAYIQQHLEQAGFRVAADRFSSADGECINLLTQPLPDDDQLPLLVVAAHYDTVPGSPGADDNASAVAALLELARWLQPHLQHDRPRRARVQLVAYDLEEYGLLGSWHHSQAIRQAGQPFLGMVSLEMLAYTDQRPGSQKLPAPVAHLYPDVANFIGVVGNETSADLLRLFVQALKGVEGLPVEFIAVPGDGRLLPETRRSDHASFWDAGLPALMITDTSFYRNPHYHQPTDTLETLDYPFLARVTQGVCVAVQALLGD